MTGRPTLFLTVGLPATGKTTAARRMEVEHSALRLTKDEWVKALYGHENPPSAQDVIEGRLIQIGLRALELGTNVVIDFGLWGRDERSALRQAASDRGAAVEMHYFEVTPAEQRSRHDQRLAEAAHTTWDMSDEELGEWAVAIDIPSRGELDGSEPIDPPTARVRDLGHVARPSLAAVGQLALSGLWSLGAGSVHDKNLSMSTHARSHPGMRGRPESRVGRRAITFAGLSVTGIALLVLSFALGIVEPADSYTDSWPQLVWGVGIWVCAVAALIAGLVAILRHHDRSWLVALATALGLLPVVLLLSEIALGKF